MRLTNYKYEVPTYPLFLSLYPDKNQLARIFPFSCPPPGVGAANGARLWAYYKAKTPPSLKNTVGWVFACSFVCVFLCECMLYMVIPTYSGSETAALPPHAVRGGDAGVLLIHTPHCLGRGRRYPGRRRRARSHLVEKVGLENRLKTGLFGSLLEKKFVPET